MINIENNKDNAMQMLGLLQDECKSIDQILNTMNKDEHLINEEALDMIMSRRIVVIDRIEKCYEILGIDVHLDKFPVNKREKVEETTKKR